MNRFLKTAKLCLLFPKSSQAFYWLIFLIALSSHSVRGAVYFKEDFSDGDKWQERWILSEHPNHTFGFFILTAGKFYGHPEESKGVQTFQDGMRYGMSATFQPFSNKDKKLVLQYTVKNEQKLKCGGGYIKLFNCSLQPELLNTKTPYLLMFGPDICIPDTLNVHVLFNYKGKYVKFKRNIIYPEDDFTHLYTLIINPDNTYVVKIDNRDVAFGKLKKDWNFLPAEEILDYDAERPEDWDNNPTIDDPNDVKPYDWDETQYIPDPTSVKPEDWDDDLDGEWEPPLIENMDFRGEWKPRRIPNPNYKGPWTRPKKRNPEYVDDPELYKFDEICGVGFDIWQAQAGTIFDNILLTDDVDLAEQHSWKVWGSLREMEKEMARKWHDARSKKHVHDEL